MADAFGGLNCGAIVAGLIRTVQRDEGLRLHIGHAADHAITAGDAVDEIVLVEAGEHRKPWIHGLDRANHLAGVADCVDRVLDADDVRVRGGKLGHELRGQVAAGARWEVIEDHRKIRRFSDRAEVRLRASRSRAEVIRRNDHERIHSTCFGCLREVDHIVQVGIAHAREHLDAPGDMLGHEVDCLLLDVQREGIELADAAKHQHAVDTGLDQMIEMPLPTFIVDVTVILGDGDGWADDAREFGAACHDCFFRYGIGVPLVRHRVCGLSPVVLRTTAPSSEGAWV